MSAPQITPVTSEEDLVQVRALFVEYAESIRYHLCFERFQCELAQLPGFYGPPEGRLLLGRVDQQSAGCVALKRVGSETAEIKRLYVRPPFRGGGLGRRLAERVLGEARESGYRVVRLDTLPSMNAARALYESLGFKPLAAPTGSRSEEPIVMELRLRSN